MNQPYQVYRLNVQGREEWHVNGPGAVETIPFPSLSVAEAHVEKAPSEVYESYINHQFGRQWIQ